MRGDGGGDDPAVDPVAAMTTAGHAGCRAVADGKGGRGGGWGGGRVEAAPTMRCWRTRANGVGGHSQPDAVHVLVVEEGGGGVVAWAVAGGGGRYSRHPPAPSAGRRRREGAASAARPAWPPRGCRVKGRAGPPKIPRQRGRGARANRPTLPAAMADWAPPPRGWGDVCAPGARRYCVTRGQNGRAAGRRGTFSSAHSLNCLNQSTSHVADERR